MTFPTHSNSYQNDTKNEPNIFDAVKREIPIDRAYRDLTGNELRGSGRIRKIRCPDPSHHNRDDQTPSALLYTDIGTWKCHKAGITGTVIDLAMETKGFGGPLEAARFLAEEYSVNHGDVDREVFESRRERQSLLARFIDYAQNQITPEQRQTIRDRLGPCEYVEDIGFEPRDFPEDEEAAREIGLVTDKGDNIYYLASNRYIIPVYRHGRPVMIVCYNPDAPKGSKYLNQAGWNTVLWGIDRVDTGKPVYLVEGVFDYLSMRAAGLETIGLFSTSLKPDQVRKLKRIAPEEIRILLDAGAEEDALRIGKALWPEIRADVLFLPGDEGTDPNKLWQRKAEFDAGRMKDTLEDLEQTSVFDRQVEIEASRGNDLEGLSEDLLELIRPLSPTEKYAAIRKIRKKTDYTKKSIQDELEESAPDPAGGGNGEEPPKNLRTQIAEHVLENATIFHDERKWPYAHVAVRDGDHTYHETLNIESSSFKNYLWELAFTLNLEEIPDKETISTAQRFLIARADRSGERISLGNRVAEKDGAIWIDMSDSRWRAIWVTDGKWDIVEDPPILFRRELHMNPQVEPDRDGDPWKLFEFANIPEEKQLLTLCYLISCWVPRIDHPVPIFHGPPGSGKSHAMRFLRMAVDPSNNPIPSFPDEKKSIIQTFDHHWMPYFDNERGLPNWLSDMVCRAVTGAGMEHRELFSDDNAFIRTYKRCVGLGGVNIAATESDLLDRSILIEIEAPDKDEYIDEVSIKDHYKQARPEIVGGMLDVFADAKAIYDGGVDIPTNRMGGFMKWGYAIAEALGEGGEKFVSDYLSDQDERVEESIETEPVGRAILLFMEEEDQLLCPTSQALKQLKEVAEENEINTDQRSWPSNASWLSKRIKMIKNDLGKKGINVDWVRNRNQRKILIRRNGQDN